MGAIAGDFFLISCSSSSDHGAFDIQDCVWYRFEARTGFVKTCLFHQCDISSIQVVRLNLSFLVSVGFIFAFESLSFCMASVSGVVSMMVGNLILTVLFMHN